MEVRESTKRLFAIMYEKSHGISVEERLEQARKEVRKEVQKQVREEVQQAELKTKTKSARKMLKKGLSPSIVGEVLDLSLEQVLAIQANLED